MIKIKELAQDMSKHNDEMEIKKEEVAVKKRLLLKITKTNRK